MVALVVASIIESKRGTTRHVKEYEGIRLLRITLFKKEEDVHKCECNDLERIIVRNNGTS